LKDSLHQAAPGDRGIDPGTDGKHPDQSDGEQMGNDDWVGINKIIYTFKVKMN